MSRTIDLYLRGERKRIEGTVTWYLGVGKLPGVIEVVHKDDASAADQERVLYVAKGVELVRGVGLRRVYDRAPCQRLYPHEVAKP